MNPRIVVVGSGMVAAKFAEVARVRNPDARITLIGDEPVYDRTQLVYLLEGTKSPAAIAIAHESIRGTVNALDRQRRAVSVAFADGGADWIDYDILVLATGAEPFMPPIPGIEKAYPLRRLADCQKILARAPEKVAVIGGGVLGIEIAHALHMCGCAVTVIHPAARVVEKQLDEYGSQRLLEAMSAEGVTFILNTSARAIGDGYVDLGARHCPCDAAIVAAGAIANDALAQSAGLACERGVIVDDDMRTSDPRIYAIGDCANYRGVADGRIARGYEQAHIVAKAIAGAKRWPPRETPAVSLKTRHKAFSIGKIDGRSLMWRTPHALRKFCFEGDRLTGAIVFGAWDKLNLLKEAVAYGKPIAAWRRLACRFVGDPWPDAVPDPRRWSDEAIVCHCRSIPKRSITALAGTGISSTQDVGAATGAGTGCGGCRPTIAALLAKPAEPVGFFRALAIISVAVALIATVSALAPLPYPKNFGGRWDIVWRDAFWKQVSGYSLLAIGLLLSGIGLRKRWSKIGFGRFDTWRIVHAGLGAAACAALLLHSGGRMGGGIAFLLTAALLALLLSGAAGGLIAATGHRLPANTAKLAQRVFTALHIAALWGMPVLLGYHIAGAYLWK